MSRHTVLVIKPGPVPLYGIDVEKALMSFAPDASEDVEKLKTLLLEEEFLVRPGHVFEVVDVFR
jgi:hypothetical protein